MVASDVETVVKLAKEIARRSDIDVLEAIERGIAEGARIVGEKFERLEIFLADLILVTEAIEAGVKVLLSKIPKSEAPEKRGVVVIGTVVGDIHDNRKEYSGSSAEGKRLRGSRPGY